MGLVLVHSLSNGRSKEQLNSGVFVQAAATHFGLKIWLFGGRKAFRTLVSLFGCTIQKTFSQVSHQTCSHVIYAHVFRLTWNIGIRWMVVCVGTFELSPGWTLANHHIVSLTTAFRL